jgi:FtsZ-binding cell division protein ZapB
MEMQQMMERLLAKMDANQAEKKTNQEMLARMEVKIEANNEKFEVLPDTLISQMDVHQERMMVCLGKMEACHWRQIQFN